MTTVAPYVPDRGDLVWLDFDPSTGREQSGYRPALVLSKAVNNWPSGLAFVVPITNQSKGYVAEVALPAGLSVQGVLLCDQARSVDWQGRRLRRVGTAPNAVLNAVLLKVVDLIT